MMLREIISVLIIVLASHCLAAQTKRFPIQHWLQSGIKETAISITTEHVIPESQTGYFHDHIEQFVLNDGQLYDFITGSGRLYQTLLTGDSIAFVRIDSTTHFGYNLGAYLFSYNKHIYNLGGYGIWRINGQLRVFNNKAHEWDIVPLNKEIPLNDESLIYYNIPSKKIYISLYTELNQAIKSNTADKIPVYDCMVLDLPTQNWYKLGETSAFLKKNLSTTRAIASSPFGLLVVIGDKLNVLDYEHNSILTIDNNKENLQNFVRAFYRGNIYFKDSTAYYGSNELKTLDSIRFKQTDFISTGEVVYTTPTNNYWVLGIGVVMMGFIGAGIYWYVYKRKQTAKQKAITENADTLQPLNSNLQQPLLDEKEIQVLQLLIDQSAKGKMTSIEDLNKVLGLTKKPIEVQKKQRSDVITSINKKYAFVVRTDDTIIERERTEFDKRSFEYYIAFAKLVAAKRLL